MDGNPMTWAEMLQGFFTNGWALSSLLAAVIALQWRRAVKLQDKADEERADYLRELIARRASDDDDK